MNNNPLKKDLVHKAFANCLNPGMKVSCSHHIYHRQDKTKSILLGKRFDITVRDIRVC